jgi:hypothetical protein
MERETKELEIAGHKLVVKTYATAREVGNIRQVYLKNTNIDATGDKPTLGNINPANFLDLQQAIVLNILVSLDGSADNLLERCLDLRSDEYDAIVAALDQIVSKKN